MQASVSTEKTEFQLQGLSRTQWIPACTGMTMCFLYPPPCHPCDWRDKQKNSAPQGGIIFLLNKIGTKSRVTDEGLCRAVLEKCQYYTYDKNNNCHTDDKELTAGNGKFYCAIYSDYELTKIKLGDAEGVDKDTITAY